MFRKNHYCEYEVVEELVFCAICGETAKRGDAI
jgi:hypothetical protein